MNTNQDNESMLAADRAVNEFSAMGTVVISKRLEQAVEALKLREASLKVRAEERGLHKDTVEYKQFRDRYNRAATLKTQLCAVGMEITNGSYTLNYSNPNKHKSRLVGGVRENSLLYRALENIRLERIELFLKSHKQGIRPVDVGLTDKQWQAIALAQHVVPSKYRMDKGNGPRYTEESAEAYLADFLNAIYERESAEAEARKETDRLLKESGALGMTPVLTDTQAEGLITVSDDDDAEEAPQPVQAQHKRNGRTRNKQAA